MSGVVEKIARSVGGAVALAAVFAVLLYSLARGQPTSIGPWATVTSVTNGAVIQIGASNSTRRSFSICAGAAGALVYALPALTPAGAAVNPTTTSGIPIANNTCFTPPANLLASGTAAGGAQAWNAISSGATTVVAFVEW